MTFDKAGLTPFCAWQRYRPPSSGRAARILRAPGRGRLMRDPSASTGGESDAPVPPGRGVGMDKTLKKVKIDCRESNFKYCRD